jgi:hypothetical protein
VPLAFALTIAAYVTIQETDQIIPDAWSVYYFYSCDITIETGYGLYILMFVISVCGIIIVFTATAISYWAYRECTRKPIPAIAPNTGGASGSSGSTLLYGTAVIDRTTEIDPLLEEAEGARRKKRGKVYQTAVEFMGATDYNLPLAAAVNVRDEESD